MPSTADPGVAADTDGGDVPLPAFPADVRALELDARAFARGGTLASRFRLTNPHHAVLHVRLAPGAPWMHVLPTETALGPGETQVVVVQTDSDAAKTAVRAGAAPAGMVQIAYQHLYPAARAVASPPPQTGTVALRLPVATCPACKRALDDAIAEGETNPVPDFCPYCFERLRPCPVCGAPNSWLARRCIVDSSHIVRDTPNWNALGGGAAHRGTSDVRAGLSLARRWSYPSVAPARRENALAWSAPVAAYGLVAAGVATSEGEAHLMAFDATNGATLWDAYPLPDPVYPDRGGAALAGGHLLAATVDGICVCVDALRGTRIWETRLNGRVYGAVVPIEDAADALVLVNVTTQDGASGFLAVLQGRTGAIRHQIELPGPPDSAPAFADGIAYAHDDRGTLTAIDIQNGKIAWSTPCESGFNAAPVVANGRVFSATESGVAFCHNAQTGEQIWRMAVTNTPFGGTPAHDGSLLYLPADDGLHLVSDAGRAVRRYPSRLPVRSAPVVAGGTLFFAASDGNVYGTQSGRPLEKLYETGTSGSQFVAAPAFADGSLFVTATNGVLYALSYAAGQTAGQGGV